MGKDGMSSYPLRIAQRMKLEAEKLESVAQHMTTKTDYCMLIAIPWGEDQDDLRGQTQALDTSFLQYLQSYSAAGISNIPIPDTTTAAYVVHVFPPCEFTHTHLQRAPDMLYKIMDRSVKHLLIVITTCLPEKLSHA